MQFQYNDISYRYPDTEAYVFRNLSLSIDRPGFHALFGPSGVGKTSLAKMMIGGLAGHTGDIRVDTPLPVLYTYNLERVPGWSSIGGHLKRVIPPDRKVAAAELVEFFGIGPQINKRFGQLSLGQKNRINLIRYLLQDFQMLIMDESLANVDELTREKIVMKVKAMFPERIFLYISHNVVEVSKFCQRIFVLRPPHKQPQVAIVEGLDHHQGDQLDAKRLDTAMLEIMNAA